MKNAGAQGLETGTQAPGPGPQARMKTLRLSDWNDKGWAERWIA